MAAFENAARGLGGLLRVGSVTIDLAAFGQHAATTCRSRAAGFGWATSSVSHESQQPIHLELSADEALVFFEFASRFTDSDQLTIQRRLWPQRANVVAAFCTPRGLGLLDCVGRPARFPAETSGWWV